MKNLFVIDGASGTGKSDLLSYVTSFSRDAAFVTKYTTREERKYEKDGAWFLDLKFVPESEFKNLDLEYQYLYSGHNYGFSKEDLDDKLRNFQNVFVIVRNIDVIDKLLLDYRFINVVPIYIYTDRQETITRLTKKGVDQNQIEFRLKRLKVAFEDYLSHPLIYKKILINSASIDEYHRLIHQTVQDYKDTVDVDEKLVAIMMSFNPDNPALEDYSEAMKQAVLELAPTLECINLEDIPGASKKLSQQATDLIKRARIVIVDLTENRPNVFYELGYAQALGKDVFMTQHESSEMMFYPREYKTIRYKNSLDLKKKLSRQLKNFFQ